MDKKDGQEKYYNLINMSLTSYLAENYCYNRSGFQRIESLEFIRICFFFSLIPKHYNPNISIFDAHMPLQHVVSESMFIPLMHVVHCRQDSDL